MFYEFIRKILCPFYQIEKMVPQKGDFLDVGCGHGTFDEILAIKSKNRKILGIDPSQDKINFAKKRELIFKNLKFKKMYINDLRNKKFDVIIIIDVLYLFSPSEMVKFLKKIKKLMKRNGVLVLKTDSREPKILHNLLMVEEFIMVKLLKFTYSDAKKTYFLSKDEYKKVMKKAGFKIYKEKEFISIFPYHHPTYLAKKT